MDHMAAASQLVRQHAVGTAVKADHFGAVDQGIETRRRSELGAQESPDARLVLLEKPDDLLVSESALPDVRSFLATRTLLRSSTSHAPPQERHSRGLEAA